MAVTASVPVFMVELAGKRVAGALKNLIADFSFDETEKQSTEVKLTLLVPAGSSVEAMAPKVGDKLRVRWGLVGALSDTEEMRVHSVTPGYGEATKVAIVARDLGDGLGRTGAHKGWENTELGDVVKDLAQEAGLEVMLPKAVPGAIGGVATSTTVVANGAIPPAQALEQAKTPNAPREAKLLQQTITLAQRGRSPRQLLQHIAAHVGCELHVSGKKLTLLPKHYAARPTVVLRWQNAQSRLLEFSPKEKQAGIHDAAARGTVAAGVDVDTGKPFVVKADDASQAGRPVLGKENPTGGEKADGAAPGSDVVYVDSTRPGWTQRGPAPATGAAAAAEQDKAGAFLPTPTGNPQDGEARAAAKFRDAESGGVTASFRVLGIPAIRKGTILDVRGPGLDKRSAGLWIVTACSHKIDANGYQTSGEARRHGANTVGKGKARTAGKPNAANGAGAGQPAEQKPQVYYQVDSRKGGAIVGTVVK